MSLSKFLAVSFWLVMTGGSFEPLSIYCQQTDVKPQPNPVAIKDRWDPSHYASVEYNSPPISDPAEFVRRQKIGTKYDNRQLVHKNINEEVSIVTTVACGSNFSPIFPTKKSALIFVGEVVKAQAFLSNDKGDVYTE